MTRRKRASAGQSLSFDVASERGARGHRGAGPQDRRIVRQSSGTHPVGFPITLVETTVRERS